MIVTTKVGRFNVPVIRHHFCSIVSMSGGEHGVRERGHFCFWTAVMKRPVKFNGKLKRKIWGRAHVTLPAGDRFDRMNRERKGKRAAAFYESAWVSLLGRGSNIAYIRPSTVKEIRLWMDTHETDAKYCTGVTMR